MATITHLHNINDIVWYLDSNNGIKKALVLSIDIDKKANNTEIKYNISFTITNSRLTVLENTIFATLSGIGSALEAYEALLLA